MITSLYTANAKLNATDKDYKKYIIIQNEEGVLMVDKGLYSLSFMNEEAILLTDVAETPLIEEPKSEGKPKRVVKKTGETKTRRKVVRKTDEQ